jgi:methyltransferase (TIGR00027 family)
MHEDKPSATAAWVAAWRGLAPWLPDGGQLANDPFGLAFAPRPVVALTARAPSLTRSLLSRGMLSRMVLWLQLRTRALDDLLTAFLDAGGKQLVLLGAGFDCRASRFADRLGVVFEIDHPATQRRKRAILSRLEARSARTEFVAWNFERDPMSQLASRLASMGHDATQPTFTIWEGVIPYLTEPAIAQTVVAIRGWSQANGSQLAFSYIIPEAMKGRSSWGHLAAILGEPWKFGWRPEELPEWMAAHGMHLVRDESDGELAQRYFPPSLSASYGPPNKHVALATPRY